MYNVITKVLCKIIFRKIRQDYLLDMIDPDNNECNFLVAILAPKKQDILCYHIMKGNHEGNEILF